MCAKHADWQAGSQATSAWDLTQASMLRQPALRQHYVRTRRLMTATTYAEHRHKYDFDYNVNDTWDLHD